MVSKGEILSQAVSNVSDELLDGARELFEKSEEEISRTQKRRQAVRRKMIYAMSAIAAACIFIVAGIAFLLAKQGIPRVYYDGTLLDGSRIVADGRAQDEPDVAAYSLERSVFEDEYELTLHIKARGSFRIEASSGVFVPDGESVISASGEADVTWAVEPDEGVYLTVSAGTHIVRVELELDEDTGLWMLKTEKRGK